MSKEETVAEYCGGIEKFVREKDYSSAQRLVSGLRKFIASLNKAKKEGGEED